MKYLWKWWEDCEKEVKIEKKIQEVYDKELKFDEIKTHAK